MDSACLEYCLTDSERDAFEQKGFFIVEDVLPPRLIEGLSAGCPLGGWIVSMRNTGPRWGWGRMSG
jgi:hypothetical protein